MSQENETQEKNEKPNPWGAVALGVFLIAVAVGLFFWFNHLEQEGGTIRMHALIILTYKLLGKWGVLGVFGAFGCLIAGIGVKDLLAGPPPVNPQPPIPNS